MKKFKKLLLAMAALGALTASAHSQVMADSGIANTMWTGLGKPMEGNWGFYGLTDCLRARIDIAMFTVEGMVNWGVLADWDEKSFDGVWFGSSSANAFTHHYYGFHGKDDEYEYSGWYNGVGQTDVKKHDDDTEIAFSRYYNNAVKPRVAQSDHYVNIVWHALKVLDFALGTKLCWGVGPAPGYYGWTWEHTSHVRQGGFSTSFDDRNGENTAYYPFHPDAPGSADVVGFVHYANSYAKKALAARFSYGFDKPEGFAIEAGLSIPQATDTNRFAFNTAFSIRPVTFLTISTVLEGLCHEDMNWYVGVDMNLKLFGLDVYFTWDGIDVDGDGEWQSDCSGYADNYYDNMSWSTGVAFSVKLAGDKMLLRPEAAINWFQESNWTPAWYVGLLWDWNIGKVFELNIWGSFAMGSKDKTWEDYYTTEDWDGGLIFDVRPNFAFHIGDQHTLSLYADYEIRRAFDGDNRWSFTTGVYWSFNVLTGKLTFAQKEKSDETKAEKAAK